MVALPIVFFDSIAGASCGILHVLKTSGTSNLTSDDQRYPTGELVRRLLSLAWRFRKDCLWSLVLSAVLLLLGIAGLKLLGVVIDVIRYALDPSLPPPVYPFGWQPPATIPGEHFSSPALRWTSRPPARPAAMRSFSKARRRCASKRA